MKQFLHFFPITFLLFLSACFQSEKNIETINGRISAKDMGKTLHHEHILVDFVGADSTGFHRWNKAEVAQKVLPYLTEIKKLGYKTLVECTPEYLGRDVELLKMLSEQSGLQIITNTGYYSTYKSKFLPQHAQTETAQQIAQCWINEAKNGIGNSGIKPGFIKIAVERAPLQPINRKIVEAACIAHKATGLTIMSHTGLAVPAFQQLETLKRYGIHPSAFIWTHANNEKDYHKQIEAAKMGAWIAFDKFRAKDVDEYVKFALLIKKHGQLPRLLISHDAGWYTPGQANGGSFTGYTDIEKVLIPALLENGLSQYDVHQIFVRNPAKAFRIGVRLLEKE